MGGIWREEPNYEPRRAKRSELAVKSFFPQSYGKAKQRTISEAINFFCIAYRFFF